VVTRSSTETFVTSPSVSWQFIVDHGDEVEPLRFEPQGEQGVGTLNLLGMKLLGRNLTAVSRTTQWTPPSRCAFESVTPARPVVARITEEFEPDDLGGTRHTITYEVVPTGWIGHPIAHVLAAVMIRSRKRYQHRLRSALESIPE
jgi:hypothetical protein